MQSGKKKELKAIQIGKEKSKTVFICTQHDKLYRKFYKTLKKRAIELISEFNKDTRFKINIQKSIPFLYTSKE